MLQLGHLNLRLAATRLFFKEREILQMTFQVRIGLILFVPAACLGILQVFQELLFQDLLLLLLLALLEVGAGQFFLYVMKSLAFLTMN
jgi:hypothetical protein